MEKEPIIQFAYFETSGTTADFILQWDQYTKGMSENTKIILQQEIGQRKRPKYLSQHKCFDEDFKFTFKKDRRSAHFPEMEMRIRQLGGYSISQLQCDHDSDENEYKVFVFINKRDANLDEYNQLSNYKHLNIYSAYFESSTYEYILEFFADKDVATEFMNQLRSEHRHLESGMYKECLLQDVK